VFYEIQYTVDNESAANQSKAVEGTTMLAVMETLSLNYLNERLPSGSAQLDHGCGGDTQAAQ
jgi:hypothetical protein